MNEITVINETNDIIDKKLLNKVAGFALESEGVKDALVNIIIVDNGEIRKINIFNKILRKLIINIIYFSFYKYKKLLCKKNFIFFQN